MARIATAIDEPEDDRNKTPAKHRGWLSAYIHAGRVGVMLEVQCFSSSVVLSQRFSELAKNLAMHIAAMSPKYISKEDVPREVCLKQEEALRQVAAGPEEVAKKMEAFYQDVCFMEQAFCEGTEHHRGAVDCDSER
jgi:elongation factor Ts